MSPVRESPTAHQSVTTVLVAGQIKNAELFMRRAIELEALARTASDGGKVTFKELATRYRRLAAHASSLATATDAEIEMLAGRIVGRSRAETEKEPDAAV